MFPGPFTSCLGVTRNRRPMLSWVVVPSRAGHQPSPIQRIILSCTSCCSACSHKDYRLSNPVLQSLGKWLARTASRRRMLSPHRLCTLLLYQGLSVQRGLAYGFTSCLLAIPKDGQQTILSHASCKPEHLDIEGRVPADSRIPSRPKVDAMEHPQTVVPLQSFENLYGYLCLLPDT
jgi:hypothetical protein